MLSDHGQVSYTEYYMQVHAHTFTTKNSFFKVIVSYVHLKWII